MRGHMPDYPLLPGVLMCEAAAQLCSYYVVTQGLLQGDFIGFGGMENVRFRGTVRPGDRLVLVGKGIAHSSSANDLQRAGLRRRDHGVSRRRDRRADESHERPDRPRRSRACVVSARLSLEALAPYSPRPSPTRRRRSTGRAVFGNSQPVENGSRFRQRAVPAHVRRRARPDVEFRRRRDRSQVSAVHGDAAGQAQPDKRARGLRRRARCSCATACAAASLQAVHVYFPDPWWKKRHHKRRVFTPEFAQQVIAHAYGPAADCRRRRTCKSIPK